MEEAGFFGKDNDAGKNGRQPEKRKTTREMDGLHERSQRLSPQEPRRPAEHRAVWPPLTHRVARSQSRLHGS